MTNQTNLAEGVLSQIQGGVVDVEFPPDQLPAIYDAVEVPLGGDEPLVLEVQQHLGHDTVRCVAMGSTDGLKRRATAYSTGAIFWKAARIWRSET